MEQIFTPTYLIGLINPVMALLFVISGLVATDKLKLQNYLDLARGNKAIIVFLVNIPIALIYFLTGTNWEVVLMTFFASSGFYSYFVKPFKSINS
jgi:hypothetical protein